MHSLSRIFSLCAAVFLVGAVSSATVAHAQFLPLSQSSLGFGARALGMGGAYTAIADDIYAPTWNPAGVAYINDFRMSGLDAEARLTGPNSFSDLFSHLPTDTNSDITFARRVSKGISQGDVSGDIAIGYRHIVVSFLPFATGNINPIDGGGGTGFKFINILGQSVPTPGSTAYINAAYGYQMVGSYGMNVDKNTKIGVNARLISYTPANITVTFPNPMVSPPTTTTTTGQQTTAFAADLGALQDEGHGLTLGASLQNILGPSDKSLFPTTLSLGAAYRPSKSTLISADLADLGSQVRINIGAEYTFAKLVSVRAGVYRGLPTVGLGLGRYINVAYGGSTSLFGVSVGF